MFHCEQIDKTLINNSLASVPLSGPALSTMAVQKSCWFKSLALSSLGVVVEGRLTGTDSPQTVILKIIEANRGYCLAYSSDTEEEVLDRQGERQG